MNGKLTP